MMKMNLHWDDYEGSHFLENIKNIISKTASFTEIRCFQKRLTLAIAKTIYTRELAVVQCRSNKF